MSGHFQSWDSTEDDGVATLLADESQRSLKVFCALCNQIYHDPHITSCGVSTRNLDPLIAALTRSPHFTTQHTFCRRCASGDTEVCPLDSTKLSLLVRNLAVAEEVGELLIHCQYGCRAGEHQGTFEVDPNGAYVCVCVSVCVGWSICEFLVTSHLSSSIIILCAIVG
jgi:E3 ubiquitin-protein ligase TRAF7